MNKAIPYKNRSCEVCGKLICFLCSDPNVWVYKIYSKFFCSWKCYREYQKGKKKNALA